MDGNVRYFPQEEERKVHQRRIEFVEYIANRLLIIKILNTSRIIWRLVEKLSLIIATAHIINKFHVF